MITPHVSKPTTLVTFCEQRVKIVCDGNCDKAWGISERPIVLNCKKDMLYYCSDKELGIAPTNPGTIEDTHVKPTNKQHNKWCARECERSIIVEPDEEKFFLINWDNRQKCRKP